MEGDSEVGKKAIDKYIYHGKTERDWKWMTEKERFRTKNSKYILAELIGHMMMIILPIGRVKLLIETSEL